MGGDEGLAQVATDRELGVWLRAELRERVSRSEVEAASDVGDARGERPAVGVSDPWEIDLGSRRVAVRERLACGDVLGTRDDRFAAVDGVEDFVVQPQDEAVMKTLGSRGVANRRSPIVGPTPSGESVTVSNPSGTCVALDAGATD